MKRILVFVLIICLTFLFCAGAQEKIDPLEDKMNDTPTEEKTTIVKPEQAKPVTHLKVILLDGINDKMFELENCIVQIVGELHMCDNVFPYQKTFINGNDYEITIMIKPKD